MRVFRGKITTKNWSNQIVEIGARFATLSGVVRSQCETYIEGIKAGLTLASHYGGLVDKQALVHLGNNLQYDVDVLTNEEYKQLALAEKQALRPSNQY